MKKNNIVRVILTSLAIILFACMAMGSSWLDPKGDGFMTDEEYEQYCHRINVQIELCTGMCLTREEMAQKLYNFEKIQKKYNGEEMVDQKDGSSFVLVLTYKTPGEHEHDENTRYMISTLPEDEHGFYGGIEIRVMEGNSACKIEESEPQQTEETTQDQPPVEDNTGNITEQSDPVQTDNTQNDDQKTGCYKLNIKRTYLKEGDPTSYTEWKYTYIVSGQNHVYKAYLPANDYHVASDTTFTATCSNPPEIIHPGDTVSFTLNLDMQHSGGMLVEASSYMLYGTPEDDGKGIKYNGTKFGPEKENESNKCIIDTMGNSNISSVHVRHTFDQEGTPGSELAIGFYGCDSLTVWIYEWIE